MNRNSRIFCIKKARIGGGPIMVASKRCGRFCGEIGLGALKDRYYQKKMKAVPTSKFRHLKGQPSAKDQNYDGVIGSETRLESNICACNRKFIAVVLATTGAGVFTVLCRDKPGRVDKVFRCIGHSTEIVDLSFDRFNPNRIVSGSEDGTYLIWWIPDEGLVADLDQIQCQFRPSQKRVVQTEWHPSAANILIGINIDSINVLNVKSGEVVSSIDTSQTGDIIYNASLNYKATEIAASFRDKKIRVYDLRTGELKKEFFTHVGPKPIKVAWITQAFDEDYMITTGATKMSEREISLWKISDPEKPIVTEKCGPASAPLNIYYDNDTRVLAFYARGEYSIKFYELLGDTEPILYYLTFFQSPDAQRALAFGNKLSCNFNSNEIMHAVRVLSKSVEEVSIIVPRKSDTFQEDLYPDTIGEVPAISPEEYIEGADAEPVKVSLKDFLPPETTVFTNLVSVTQVSKQSDAKPTKGVSGGYSGGVNVADELSSLRSELEDLKERVIALERSQ
ncbi:Coronin-1A [Thelohanellus kitauei]|uniref:Coronin-1A n=1 Tax=Thelohanellus kitauei TaxID=669202 RepID=A0A0C2N1R3_THEKT|nr:Coronin-1A [Thelohanellus kitauei]